MTTTDAIAYLTGDYTCSVCQTTRFVAAPSALPACCGLGIQQFWDHQNTLGAPLHQVEVTFTDDPNRLWRMPMTEQATTREFYNVWEVLPGGEPGPHRGLFQVITCLYMAGVTTITMERQGDINPRLRLHAIYPLASQTPPE